MKKYILDIIMALCLCFMAIELILFYYSNYELQKRVEFEYLREAEIIYITDCCVYVIDDYVNQVIEIDIFNEVIYTKIEVGDTALYVIDYDYTDADLLGIIKK